MSVMTGSTGAGYSGLLRNRRFLLWQSSAQSAGVGYSVYSITVLWLAYRISGSLLLSAIVLGVEYGAYTLTFLIAPLVDRARNKRTVYLACYPIQGVAAATIGLSYLGGTLTVPLLLGMVVVLSVLWDFVWAVDQVVPRLLVGKDDLLPASGLSSAFGGVNQITGFALGGALIVVVGPGFGTLLYAGLLALALLLILAVPILAPETGKSNFLEEFRVGWRFFRPEEKNPLLPLAVVGSITGFFAAAPPLLITLSANLLFSNSAFVYGVLFTGYIVGGAVVGLVVGHLNPRHRVGWMMIIGLVVMGLSTVLAVKASPAVVLSGLGWFAVGAGYSAHNVGKYAFLQGWFPPGAIGRVASNLYMFTGITSTVGALTIGLLSTSSSPLLLALLSGLGFLLAAVVCLGSRGIRQMAY